MRQLGPVSSRKLLTCRSVGGVRVGLPNRCSQPFIAHLSPCLTARLTSCPHGTRGCSCRVTSRSRVQGVNFSSRSSHSTAGELPILTDQYLRAVNAGCHLFVLLFAASVYGKETSRSSVRCNVASQAREVRLNSAVGCCIHCCTITLRSLAKRLRGLAGKGLGCCRVQAGLGWRRSHPAV